MRVRLAFAVAAHLEPEILLIDEVLAVGDAAFQQKCLGKIGEVSRAGRTVLFVSHSAAAIESLCTRGVVLEHGGVTFDGTQTDAIDFYSASRAGRAGKPGDLAERTDRRGSGEVRITGVEVRNSAGVVSSTVRSGEDVEIALRFKRRGALSYPRLAVEMHIGTHLGAPVFTQANWLGGQVFGDLPETGTMICKLPQLPLPAGSYSIGFHVCAEEWARRDPLDEMDHATELHVEAGDFFGSGKLPHANTGMVLAKGSWRIE